MSGSVNRVILIGNLCADPEAREFQNGGRVVNMRIATNESWRDKSTGERKEKAEYHSVAIFNEGLAKVAEQYLSKGSKVYVEGQLETRKWQDQSGNDRYTTEVVLRPYSGSLVLLGDPGGREEDEDDGYDRRQSSGGRGAPPQRRRDSYKPPPAGRSQRHDLDDEIPF